MRLSRFQTFLTGRPFLDDLAIETPNELENVDRLDGCFGRCRVQDDEVVLGTDLIGAGPVYYTEQAGTAYFASELGALLRLLPQSPSYSWLGVAAQLFAQSQVWDETHFAGVFRVPAGSEIHLRADRQTQRVAVRRHSDLGIMDLRADAVPPMTAESLKRSIQNGVHRERYDENDLLMLSAGRDSLAIALSGGAPQRTATYGAWTSRDRIGGLRQAHSLRLPYAGVPYESWNLGTYASLIINAHAGASGLQTGQNIVAFDWATQRWPSLGKVSVGFLGDALTGAHQGRTENPTDDEVLKVLVPNSRAVPGSPFEAEGRQLIEFVMQTFRDRCGELPSHIALLSLDLEWRQARWIAMMFDLCDRYAEVSYPFFTRALFAMAMQADWAAVNDQRAYDACLDSQRRTNGDAVARSIPLSLSMELKLRSLLRRRPIVSRVDWDSVLRRGPDLSTEFAGGSGRLNDVLRQATTSRSGERIDWTTAAFCAPMSAAIKRDGEPV